METQTLVALVGVGSALIGSAIGGLISFFSTRSVRRMEWVPSLAEKNIHTRESLYADFLTEANRLMLEAIDGKLSQSTAFATLVGLEARLWFFSNAVGEAARNIVVCVMDHHSQEPKNDTLGFPELRDKFIAQCKEDVLALRKNV